MEDGLGEMIQTTRDLTVNIRGNDDFLKKSVDDNDKALKTALEANTAYVKAALESVSGRVESLVTAMAEEVDSVARTVQTQPSRDEMGRAIQGATTKAVEALHGPMACPGVTLGWVELRRRGLRRLQVWRQVLLSSR